MEKASKWIRNHLMGKKEAKYKVDRSYNENNIAESPKVKRRWSLGRKSSTRTTGNATAHRFSASFDSSYSANLQVQSLLQTDAPYILSTCLLPKAPTNIESSAATKIQAAFRSYLARKALLALRGLVKIQAQVRGHLVRKQTSATLRGMHALMAIQVRARIQRLQTAQEANLLLPKYSPPHPQISRDMVSGITPSTAQESKDPKDMDLKEMLEIMGSRSGPLDPSDTEHAVMSFYPKEKYQYQDHALNAEPSSSRNSLSSNQRHSMSRAPNGLTRTESSRAKARSCSEPKQRPVQGTRRKNKPVESTKDLNFSLDGRRQSMSSNSLRFIYHGNEDHWVMNHYESSTDSKSGSFHGSTATSNSCY
ncbi:protein IQ-DOMAIN 19-like [Prosopis cineraria]|uniref:protein IQ-DOMAIN 19-like n=1 Tax=Prosopis cineraria TaxID=364024 RepID=UPI0024109B52|nr:protein IQ-DOMAIN 19-like [Prosopis cineraria]